MPDENTDTISMEIAVFWSLILSTSMYWLVTAAICKRLTKSLPKHTSPQYHVKGSPLCYCHLEKREPAQSLHCSKRERQHIHYFFSIEQKNLGTDSRVKLPLFYWELNLPKWSQILEQLKTVPAQNRGLGEYLSWERRSAQHNDNDMWLILFVKSVSGDPGQSKTQLLTVSFNDLYDGKAF